MNDVQRKIKNGYVAVFTPNFTETFNVINKMNNGKNRINVCVIGIGDVCSALVQGISNYKKNPDKIIWLLT